MYINKDLGILMQNLCFGGAKEQGKRGGGEWNNWGKTSQVHIEATVILDKGLCVWKGRKKLCLNSKVALSLVEELSLIVGWFFFFHEWQPKSWAEEMG